MVAAREQGYVCVCNVHTVMASDEDPGVARGAARLLDERSGRAAARVGDQRARSLVGRPRLRSRADVASRARVPPRRDSACTCMAAATKGALVQLALNLRQRYPGVKIVGGYSPPTGR